MNKTPECPYCNATVILSAVCHEPHCPTWDMEKNDEIHDQTFNAA